MSGTLFAAWRPDADGRERLAALAAKLAAARPDHAPKLKLRGPDQWHVTLCFVGRNLGHVVTPALLDAFAGAAMRIPPHAFTIERIACWPQAGVIVALPHACAELQALCDATRDAIRGCGIRPAQVSTQPHVTLAYLDRGVDEQGWLAGIDCTGEPLHVDRFELLFNPGGRYEALGQWPLAGITLPAGPPQQGVLL